MKHLGDITKIHGCAVPITDCVVGGSPCQDLSVAGKREGLAGARSGLFMEQIRIVKEMRYADKCSGRTGQFIRPRYMVWENVPGAFSSNKGEDFRAVLEETARISDSNADVPQPPNGKWANAGCIVGDGWSVAWRVHDAQFWGVPQRRRRIALVADFGGHTAPEILFEHKGLCWDSAESGEAGQGTAGDFEDGAGAASRVKCLNPWDAQSGRCYSADGVWHSLNANENGGQSRDSVCYPQSAECGGNKPAICYGIGGFNSAGMLSDNPKAGIYEADTSRTIDQNGGNPACNQGGICIVAREGQNGKGWKENVSYGINGEVAGTLDASYYKGCGMREGKEREVVVVAAVDCRNSRETGETYGTLQAKENGGQSLNYMGAVRTGCSVRRLTPLECERLQGYQDGWTDIPGASDSARYKALGNSIALPFWRWMLQRMSTYLPADATLGSLFDGIGGFPLIWEQLNGKGSCLWASEIEEFPIAVTKRHFSELEATP